MCEKGMRRRNAKFVVKEYSGMRQKLLSEKRMKQKDNWVVK
uniref:Uncharacterized protein n=1 Tax=Parascaris equorum TaxID=6256 RepID=A0A914RJU9_PAREQ